MSAPCFIDWLTQETFSYQISAISLYENRNRLLYIDAPALRKQYLNIFGENEDAVLKSELETLLLKYKLELIQSAINRREKFDLDLIEEKLNARRAEQLSELESNDTTLNELPQLSEQEKSELERLYHDITRSFHPEINIGITDVQKELYKKALEAFKMQDIEALKLIHGILFFDMSLPDNLKTSKENSDNSDTDSMTYNDYSLAKLLFPCFAHSEKELVLLDTIQKCRSKIKDAEIEIEKIKGSFPFTAVETMNDKSKTEEYMAELKIRESRSKAEQIDLQNKNQSLLGDALYV